MMGLIFFCVLVYVLYKGITSIGQRAFAGRQISQQPYGQTTMWVNDQAHDVHCPNCGRHM